MQTEDLNPRTAQLDQFSARQIVEVMNEEDATVALAVQRALPAIAAAVEGIVARMRQGGRLFYVGAGTSGRLGVLDAVECVPTFGVDSSQVVGVLAGGERALVHSVEGAEDDPAAGRRDLLAQELDATDAVVAIAASGRTPYVLGALDAANEIGALTVAVTCNDPAPMLDAAQIGIAALVGPEVLAGSTRLKAGTAQKMILNMISTATMVQLGKAYGNLMVDVRVTNHKLAMRARGIVMRVTGIGEDEAARLLTAAGNEVKPAIVMAKRGVSLAEAQRLLDDANGMLRAVIG